MARLSGWSSQGFTRGICRLLSASGGGGSGEGSGGGGMTAEVAAMSVINA